MLYIADTDNNRVRKVDTDGTITTVAGNGDEAFTGDGIAAAGSALALPRGVAVSADGLLYIADSGNNRIRRVGTDGTITTVAGNGSADHRGDGGPAVEASLDEPRAVAVAPDGQMHIADWGNDRIRRVDADGEISTVG